jgi:high-affinity iron transporter
MRREGTTGRRGVATVLLGLLLSGLGGVASLSAEVSGVVRMPDICSPSVSPAVVYLSPVGAKGVANERKPVSSIPGEMVLVNQRGLQFTPRVQAIAVGHSVRFTNQDGENHNVHIVTPGFAFNQSMAPGNAVAFTPDRPGVMILACDIHSHMRGFVVVSPTPWVQVCSRQGRFRLEGVPDGRYMLNVWHEMGEPLRREIVVGNGKAPELPELVLTGPSNPVRVAAGVLPVRQWREVIDRIGVALTASRNAATRAGELARARRLADDAYFGEFEASDMETGVRRHLGYVRSGEIEQQFREYRTMVRAVAEHRRPVSALDDMSQKLMHDLVAAARELDSKGVTDASRIDAVGVASAEPRPSASTRRDPHEDPTPLVQALRRGFDHIRKVAEQDGPEEATSELSAMYWSEFEPLERYLDGRSSQSIRPLEIQFAILRGDVSAGLKGEELAGQLNKMASEVETLVDRLKARPVGTLGTAFVESLITIVREGVEVILVLAMLLALVAKVAPAGTETRDGTANHDTNRARALRAIWYGVALAVIASLATAVALNLTVSSMQGRAREILEGVVMLVAAGVLFYVSYWLVSQAEAKRWMDFLKQQARRGLEWGGRGTLGITAFLAVYREGAETSLMYQALLGSQGQTRTGFLGLTVGFVVGLVILAAIAVLVRATSVRLPLRTFFKFSGLFLFVLAVVFAGNGVFELQNAGILITTHLAWMGNGFPLAGLYPNLQVVLVQGFLVAGALLTWAVMPGASRAAPKSESPPTSTGTTTAVPSERSDSIGGARDEGRMKTDRSEPVLLTRPSPLAPRPS